MTRRPAVIFDRDGTLASVAWCAPRDRAGSAVHLDPRDVAESWRTFNAMLPFDPVVPEVAALFRSIRPDVVRIVVSGRAAGERPGDYHRLVALRTWLAKHDLAAHHVIMREGGDMRRDSVVKREIYERFIEPAYDVRLAVDDRPVICDLWRSLGIPVVQVRDPGLVPTLDPSDGGRVRDVLR